MRLIIPHSIIIRVSGVQVPVPLPNFFLVFHIFTNPCEVYCGELAFIGQPEIAGYVWHVVTVLWQNSVLQSQK